MQKRVSAKVSNSHCEFALLRKKAKAKRRRFASLRFLGRGVRFASLSLFERPNSQKSEKIRRILAIIFQKKSLPGWLKFIFFFIILGKNIEKTTKIDNEGYYQFEISSDRLIFYKLCRLFLETYQNDRPVKGCKSPQPPHPRFEDRKRSVGLMVGLSVGSRGRHSDKFSCSVRPTAEPRSKILACPTESRAEPNCPIVRKSLGSALGSAPEHFFGQIRTVGQPNSRESRSIFSLELTFFSN